MFSNPIIILFNNFILYFFRFIYKWFKIETLEDKFHKHKIDNKSMNIVKIKFNKKNEFDITKSNVFAIINNNDFLKKYDITTYSILNNTNNKFFVSFKANCIYIYFNHYYISGSNMFILLNKIVNSNPPKFLKTNPFYGLINLPFYLYELSLLKKRKYLKINKLKQHLIIEKNINTNNKRCYLYFNILQKYINLFN